jgi:hypothetical protein
MGFISNLKRWTNGEIFNARDYVYERDLLVAQINRLSNLVGDVEPGTPVNVFATNLDSKSISLNNVTITDWEDLGQTFISTFPPSEGNGQDGNFWIEYEE